MCMIVAVAAGGVGVLAVDTRWRAEIDGRFHCLDAGRKMKHAGDGFVAVSGCAMTGHLGLREISDAADLQHVSAGLRASHLAYGRGIRAALPHDVDTTRFLAVRHAGGMAEVHHFSGSGEHVQGGPNRIITSTPPEMDDETASAMRDRLRAEIAAGRTMADLFRAVAATFVEAAARSESMSDTVEIGAVIVLPDRTLCSRIAAPARALAALSTAEMEQVVAIALQTRAPQGLHVDDEGAAAELDTLIAEISERLELATAEA